MNGTIGNELIWESDVVYEGFHSFKITKSYSTSSAVGWISDNNANLYWNHAESGIYELSGYIKTIGVNTSPANDAAKIGIVFEFKDASGNELVAETIWADQSLANKDWEQLVGMAVLTEAPESVVMKLIMGKDATGTVYFDNIRCNTTDSWSIMGPFNRGAETIEGWLNWYSSTNGSYGTVTDNAAHTGTYSAELFKPDTTSSSSEIVYYSIPVAVEAGEWYKIGVWVKTQEVNIDAAFEPTYITTERLDDRLGLCYFFHTGDIDHGWSVSGRDKFVYVDQTTADKEWTHYVVAEKAPDDATGISVRARFTSYPTGTAWFDDFSVEKIIVDGCQLIQNPSFEDQMPTFWSELNGTIGNELGIESMVVYEGFHSFNITKSSVTSNIVGWISDNNANLYWNNAGDGTYEISGMVKTVGVNTSPTNDIAKIGVVFEFKNASGAELVTETLWADQTIAFKDWDELTGGAVLTEAPASVVIKLIMGKDATGTVYFDNISCGTTPSWTMMVFNHGAETVDDWMVWYASNNGSYGIVTDNQANTGSYSAELYKPVDTEYEIVYYSIPVSVEAGEWYKVGVWVKTEGVNTDATFEPTYITKERIDDRICLCYFFHTGSITEDFALSGGDKFVYIDQTTADKEWTHYVVAEKAPDDATGISVRARFTSYPTGTAWFDDFSVIKMVVETPYIEPEDEWIIRLFAYSDEFSDNNYLGTSYSATDGFDPDIDIPKPPPPTSDYLQLYFPHPEWGQALENFKTDIRYPFDLLYFQKIWNFSVTTDQAGELVTIKVQPQYGIDYENGIYLKDMSTSEIVQLSSSTNIYSFTPGAEGIYNFQLMIGRLYPVQEITHGFNAGWNMMGLPLKPLTNSVSDLFGDDIAGTSYFYKYAGNTGYEQTEYMYRGFGYWMGLFSNETLSYIGDSLATTVSVNLINGNNLISNPFKYTICTNNLTFTKQSTTLSYDDAILNNWISGAIHHWDNNAGGIYISTDTLDMWWGAWMYALTDGVTLNIDPGTIPKGYTTKSNSIGDNEWLVNLQLSSAWGSDVSSGFGMADDASDGFDAQFDYPEPPTSPSGKYLAGYFVHDDWNVLGPKYDRDIRVFANADVIWHYTVKSSKNGNITLSWEGLNIPESVSLILHDPVMNLDIDMKARTQYDFNYQDDIVFEITKTVMTSIENEDLIPKEYRLAQNYPNPFNPVTKIEYQLPKDGRVHLAIYNINGQLIKTLINENQAAGYYAVQFNAAELSSGVYLYRIQASSPDGVGANEFTDIKKCMIIK